MGRPANDRGETLIELFLDMLAAERGARPNTLAAYRKDLEDFGDFATSTGAGIAKAFGAEGASVVVNYATNEAAARAVVTGSRCRCSGVTTSTA